MFRNHVWLSNSWIHRGMSHLKHPKCYDTTLRLLPPVPILFLGWMDFKLEQFKRRQECEKAGATRMRRCRKNLGSMFGDHLVREVLLDTSHLRSRKVEKWPLLMNLMVIQHRRKVEFSKIHRMPHRSSARWQQRCPRCKDFLWGSWDWELGNENRWLDRKSGKQVGYRVDNIDKQRIGRLFREKTPSHSWRSWPQPHTNRVVFCLGFPQQRRPRNSVW